MSLGMVSKRLDTIRASLLVLSVFVLALCQSLFALVDMGIRWKTLPHWSLGLLWCCLKLQYFHSADGDIMKMQFCCICVLCLCSFEVWEHNDLMCECSSLEVKVITGPINTCLMGQHKYCTDWRVPHFLFFPPSDAELPPDGKRSEYVSISIKHINWQANTLQRLHQFTCKRNKRVDKRAAHFLLPW